MSIFLHSPAVFVALASNSVRLKARDTLTTGDDSHDGPGGGGFGDQAAQHGRHPEGQGPATLREREAGQLLPGGRHREQGALFAGRFPAAPPAEPLEEGPPLCQVAWRPDYPCNNWRLIIILALASIEPD
jgi:hypothetical protein